MSVAHKFCIMTMIDFIVGVSLLVGVSDSPFSHTMRMLIRCCHGDVM